MQRTATPPSTVRPTRRLGPSARAGLLLASVSALALAPALAAHGLAAGSVKPSTSRTVVGKPASFTATFDGDLAGSTVTLQRLVPGNAWVDVAAAAVEGRAATAPAPTGFYGRHVLRLHAALTDGSTLDSDPGTIQVRPAHRPRGKAGQHVLMTGFGVPIMWDSCTTIDYRVNTDQAPRGAVRDIAEAVRRIGEATGLTFRYLGTTSLIPDSTNPWASYGDADVVVAWRDPSQDSGLGGALGYGGPTYSSGHHTVGGLPVNLATSGRVVLSTRFNDKLAPGFGRGATRGKVLMHELGHLVGLDHAPHRSQVMYPSLQRAHGQHWGAGDIRAFSKVGAQQGCVATASTPFRSLAVPRTTVRH